MKKFPYREDVGHYWKTGTSDADKLIDDVVEMIEGVGGSVTGRLFGRIGNQEAYQLNFSFGDHDFEISWPVLDPISGDSSPADQRAARRQAATFIKHDVKSRLMNFKVWGFERAFFDCLKLPDGRPITQVALPDLSREVPKLGVVADDSET